MIIYYVIGIQCVLITYCFIATIIYKNIAPGILKMKKRYNEKVIVAFSMITMCSGSILISIDKISSVIIGSAIMFFLSGLLFLAEALIKPYISEKGVVSNCKLYKWNNVKLMEIRDSNMTFQVSSYLGKR